MSPIDGGPQSERGYATFFREEGGKDSILLYEGGVYRQLGADRAVFSFPYMRKEKAAHHLEKTKVIFADNRIDCVPRKLSAQWGRGSGCTSHRAANIIAHPISASKKRYIVFGEGGEKPS